VAPRTLGSCVERERGGGGGERLRGEIDLQTRGVEPRLELAGAERRCRDVEGDVQWSK